MTVGKRAWLFAAFFVVGSQADGAAAGSLNLENRDYYLARREILANGWRPAKGRCEGASIYKGACSRYPEIDICSVSFPILCGMTFTRRTDCLYVDTRGEGAPSGDQGVAVVIASEQKPCPKR